MSVAEAPDDVRTAVNIRYAVNRPLIGRRLLSGDLLVLHPPTGSWIIAGQDCEGDLAGLLEATADGLLDGSGMAPDHPLLAKLAGSGIVSIDGRSAWTGTDFANVDAKLGTLILKMVGYCNIACSYCYDFDSTTYKSKLAVEDAIKAVDGALAVCGERLNILFHGGEPLLAFPEIVAIVEHAERRVEKGGAEILFSIQTNGTRFTREIVDFLIEKKFSIGLSLDGDRDDNDAHRVTFSGKGTYEGIAGGLEHFPEIAERAGILTTVTSANAHRLLDIARHFKALGFTRWDISVFQEGGRGLRRKSRFAPDPGVLLRSYVELLDAVEAGEMDRFEVRPVLHYIRNVLSPERRNMCQRNGCGAAKDLVSLSADGMIESCDCISNPALSLGHIGETGIGAALRSAAGDTIRSRTTATLQPCETCDWRIFCGGTCLAKAGEIDAVVEDECELSMALFPEVFERLARSDKLIRYAEQFAG